MAPGLGNSPVGAASRYILDRLTTSNDFLPKKGEDCMVDVMDDSEWIY